jgi:hypothetical protein
LELSRQCDVYFVLHFMILMLDIDLCL